MQVGNTAGFDGLASLSRTFGEDPLLVGLASFLSQRERGLRRVAQAALSGFLESTHGWDAETQRRVVVRVLDAHWATPTAHQFLVTPLRAEFIEPVLVSWREAEPENPLPVRHLALLRRDVAMLDEALRLDASAEDVRLTLVELLVDGVAFATQYVAEGAFRGSPAFASESLERASALLAASSRTGSLAHLQRQVEAFSQLLADWEAYQSEPEGTFLAWCDARGSTQAWWPVVVGAGVERPTSESRAE